MHHSQKALSQQGGPRGQVRPPVVTLTRHSHTGSGTTDVYTWDIRSRRLTTGCRPASHAPLAGQTCSCQVTTLTAESLEGLSETRYTSLTPLLTISTVDKLVASDPWSQIRALYALTRAQCQAGTPLTSAKQPRATPGLLQSSHTVPVR